VVTSGSSIGNMLSLFLGGYLNDVMSWRKAFILVGLPGVLLAILVALTVKEPLRPPPASDAPAPPKVGIRFFLSLPSYRHLLVSVILMGAFGYARVAFHPAFFMRTYHLKASEVGLWLGIIYGVVGVGGTLLSGYLADRLARRDIRWIAWLPSVFCLLGFPLSLAAYLAPDKVTSLWLLTAPTLCALAYQAPTFAAAQLLAPEGSQSTSSALLIFGMSLIGASMGPLIVGMLSDALAANYHQYSLRYAMSIVSALSLWAAIHFFLAGRRLGADVARVQAMAA
jgi:predicted MFS family arabinose efflux permease